MDEGDSGGLGSFFINHQRHHLIDGATSSFSGNAIFSPPSSAAGDANPSAIPAPVRARPSHARPAAVATAAAESAKRKRGRPRKYGTAPSLPSLSIPTSAMSAASQSMLRPSPSSSTRKKKVSNSSSRKSQLAALGRAGQGFIPHVITVSAGEDLVNKLVSMMQQGKRAVCILSATGSVLNPSLRQPASSGSYVTHEGLFEIISLFGSLLYSESSDTSSKACGLGICLSGVDGRIVGGSVEGPLVAAGPLQVIAGSFLIDIDMDFSSSSKVDGFANKLTTEAAAMNMESILRTSRMMNSSGEGDERQSVGGGFQLLHSRPMFLSPEWEGRHISGSAGTSQSSDDEYIRN